MAPARRHATAAASPCRLRAPAPSLAGGGASRVDVLEVADGTSCPDRATVTPAANRAAEQRREHGGGDRAGHLPRRGPPRLRRDLRRDLDGVSHGVGSAVPAAGQATGRAGVRVRARAGGRATGPAAGAGAWAAAARMMTVGGVAGHDLGTSATTMGNVVQLRNQRAHGGGGIGRLERRQRGGERAERGDREAGFLQCRALDDRHQAQWHPGRRFDAAEQVPQQRCHFRQGRQQPGRQRHGSVGVQPDVAGVQPCPDGPAHLR